MANKISPSRQAYIDKYAEAAMEQMRRYGIPASITLAQGIIESGDGKSVLAQEANNHFGIKGTFHGQYMLRDDEKKNEKFRKYDTVEQSFEDHSKVLMNKRYQKYVGNLSHDDYKGWAEGIKKGGYATSSYSGLIVGVIEGCNLAKYDKMVMEQMKGKQWGVKANPSKVATVNEMTKPHESHVNLHQNVLGASGHYCMPLKVTDNLVVVTSSFGVDRKDHRHAGVDIRAREPIPLLATEDNGKVIKVDNAGAGAAGKYVVVEYDRPNGEKFRCTYMHMSNIQVQTGQQVNSSTVLGLSGNTGRSEAPHLHFETARVSADGKVEKINPCEYLARITVAANMPVEVREKGTSKDLLAEYKAEMTQDPIKQQQYDIQAEETLEPDDWFKKLLMSDNQYMMAGQGGDLFSKILEMMLMLWLVASQQQKDQPKAQQIQAAAEAALNRTIDLSAYCARYKSVQIKINDNNKAVLVVDDGSGKLTNHVLSPEEVDRITSIAKGQGDEEAKGRAIGNAVNGIMFSQQASMNYEELEKQQQTQQQQMQR